jgi:choline dehydrogenase-like flavoprotein
MTRSWDTPDRQRDGKVFVFNDRGLPNYRFEDAMIAGKSKVDLLAEFESTTDAGLHAFIEEFGEPHNRLTLAGGTGLFGLPNMAISFSRPPEVEATISRVVSDIQDILDAAGYTLAGYKQDKPRGDHASGSLRMGIDESLSVTNPDLQVHGFDNLYVCSNAVLPNAAAVNPTLTLSALALRLGSRLGAAP